jgi:hypothetical protein
MNTENTIERRPVVGYEGLYEVSRDGEVFRVFGGKNTWVGRKLKQLLNNRGYLYLTLYSNGVKKQHLVHRLVVSAFVPNPHNLPQTNHINGIKSDNCADNLEPCDSSHNQRHAYRVLGKKNARAMQGKPRPEGAGKPKRPVRGTNLKTGEVVEMASTKDAARFVNGSHGHIGKSCQGKYKHAYGWRWEYID